MGKCRRGEGTHANLLLSAVRLRFPSSLRPVSLSTTRGDTSLHFRVTMYELKKDILCSPVLSIPSASRAEPSPRHPRFTLLASSSALPLSPQP